MRMKLIFSILSSMLLLCSCDSGIDEELLARDEPIPILLALQDGMISTRAPVNLIDSTNITSVGVYGVLESSTSGVFPWTASPYLLNLTPAKITNGQISFSPKLYYPEGGKRIKFYGYYPRTTATSGNNYVTPPANGVAPVFNFTLTGQEDIMYAVGTPTGSNTPGVAALTFNHKLTQIRLSTSALTGLLASVKIVAVKNKGALNIETGVVTYTSSTIDLTVTPPALTTNTIPVMVPADVASYKVEVALLSLLKSTYIIKPTSGNFLAGTIYQITL